MVHMAVNLRLEAADGSGIEEYRLQDGNIEVRRSQRPIEHRQWNEQWHRLSASEIASRLQGNTVVAHWLRHRIGWRRVLLACADEETREMFGVSKAPEGQPEDRCDA